MIPSPHLRRSTLFSSLPLSLSNTHSPAPTPILTGSITPTRTSAGHTAPNSPPQHSSLAGFCSPPRQDHDSLYPSELAHYNPTARVRSPPSSFAASSYQSPTDSYSEWTFDSHSHYEDSERSHAMTSLGSSSSSSSHLHIATPPSDAGSGSFESDFAMGFSPVVCRACGVCGWTSPHEEQLRLHLRSHASREPFQCFICPDAFDREADFLAHDAQHSTMLSSSRKREWDAADQELMQPTLKRACNPAPPTPELTPLSLQTSAYYHPSAFSPIARSLSYGGQSDNSPPLPVLGAEYPFQPSAPYLHATAQLQSHYQLEPAFAPTRPSARRSDSAPMSRASTYPYPPSPASSHQGGSPSFHSSTPFGVHSNLPVSPMILQQHSPHTPSQAALHSAASMNRLLAGLPALPLQRRNTSPSVHYSPQELVHLHHTPASNPRTLHPLSPQSPFGGSDHFRLHESRREERGHTCPESHCKRTFKRLEHLRRHERTHTSDKPHGCDWDGCGRYFSRSDNLTQHKKTHTKVGGRNGPGGRSARKARC